MTSDAYLDARIAEARASVRYLNVRRLELLDRAEVFHPSVAPVYTIAATRRLISAYTRLRELEDRRAGVAA